jgi:hypothetical protein
MASARPPLPVGITSHLREIIRELEEYPVPDYLAGIVQAGLLCADEVTAAIDGYFVDLDSKQLHREVIGSLLDFIQRWETWLDTKPLNPMSATFHSMLLRFLKGSVKVYRIWCIDCQASCGSNGIV